jgi:hypothetical protein
MVDYIEREIKDIKGKGRLKGCVREGGYEEEGPGSVDGGLDGRWASLYSETRTG